MSVHYLSEGGLFRHRSLGISPEGNASVAPQMLKWESPTAHRLTMGKFSGDEVAKGVDSTSSINKRGTLQKLVASVIPSSFEGF